MPSGPVEWCLDNTNLILDAFAGLNLEADFFNNLSKVKLLLQYLGTELEKSKYIVAKKI